MATFQDSWRAGGTGKGAYVLKPNANTQVPLSVDGISSSLATDILFRVRNSAGTSLLSVDNSGNLTFTGSATIVINEAVTGNLTVTGISSFTGDITSLGSQTFGTNSSGVLTVKNNLSVGGTSTLNILTVNGNATFNGVATFSSFSPGNAVTFTTTGAAITGGNYAIGRDNAGTNLMFMNVPTGSSFRFAVNGTNIFNATTTVFNLGAGAVYQVNAVNVLGNGSGYTNVYAGSVAFRFLNQAGQVSLGSVNTTGQWALTPAVTSGGSVAQYLFTSAADTALAAATEANCVNWNLAATRTWASGAGPLATQREFLIQAPTYSGNAGGALTITNAATFAISGAPVQGTNMTLTNTYAMFVQGGNSRFDGHIGSTATTLTLGVAATVIALAGKSNVVTVTGDGGANTIATMTGGLSGEMVTLVFADANVSVTDNGAAPAANQFDLSAAFTSALHKTLTVVLVAAGYWVEVARSTNT